MYLKQRRATALFAVFWMEYLHAYSSDGGYICSTPLWYQPLLRLQCCLPAACQHKRRELLDTWNERSCLASQAVSHTLRVPESKAGAVQEDRSCASTGRTRVRSFLACTYPAAPSCWCYLFPCCARLSAALWAREANPLRAVALLGWRAPAL